MSAEIVQTVKQASPYLTAALSAYGAQVLAQAENAAAEATANLGRRILQAVWRRRNEKGRAALEEAVHDAAEESADTDAVAALRQQVKRALREDTELLKELVNLMSSAPACSIAVTASGARSIATQNNYGIQITGDWADISK